MKFVGDAAAAFFSLGSQIDGCRCEVYAIAFMNVSSRVAIGFQVAPQPRSV
jgi:hypothetical protein